MGIRWFAGWAFTILIACGSVPAVADTACQIVIGKDVLRLDGLVQQLPISVVGVAPEVAYCAPEVATADATRATPAIVFIIDDSGSMMQNDKNANRYTVTGEILDEIYREAPGTRVAVVTFRNWLAWDWRQNSEFRRISAPFAWNDSYFPLAPLDSVFADGKRTIDKIKRLFTLDEWKLLQAFHSDSTERTRPLEFDDKGNPLPPSRNQQGTDITLAFMAAKDALRTTSTPVERQFIVFLSDGLHGAVDVEMEGMKTDYIDGSGVPTTYAIFLGDSVKEPPQQLRTMVANIQTSGYSSANPNSQLWSIVSTHDTLLALMQREILTQVYAPLRRASKASTGTMTTARVTGTELIFNRPLALAPDTTVITFDVVFPLSDAKGNPKGDTVVSSTVTFIRNPRAEHTSLHDGLRTECYERDLRLESGNTAITSAITNAQTILDARFTLEGIDPSSNQRMVVSADPATDSVTMKINYAEGKFSGTVLREQTDTPVGNDATVQHPIDGALRFTWRNPDLPLDTFTRIYPVTQYDLTVNDVDFTVIAGPNPVILGSRSSVKVNGWGVLETGTIIGIIPNFPVADISRVIEKVDVRIYDAVGNLVAFNPENRPVGRNWYIHWDCTNRNHRQVGSGVYLAVLGFDAKFESKTEKIKKTIKIAVR